MRTRSPLAAALLAVLVALVACGKPADEPAGADPLTVTVMDFMLDPDTLEAAGPTVTIEVTNDGPTPHNFTIRDAADEILAATADLSTGESETISAELDPGDYTIFCSLAGHESLGMSGTLTVSAP